MTFRKFFAVGAVAAVLISSLAIDASAQGRGRGRGRGRGQDKNDKNDKNKGKKAEPAQTQVVGVFRDSDRVTLREYFVTQRIVAQQLPPGIAMNVARGKSLPPGIAKKIIPAHVIVTGTRVDPTITYYVVGDRVVAVRNGTVIDILLDIFR